MPGIKCKCGNTIDIGRIPNPNELLLISDMEYDNFSGQINSEELYLKFKSMLSCDCCKRLLYFKNGFDNNPEYYKLECPPPQLVRACCSYSKLEVNK